MDIFTFFGADKMFNHSRWQTRCHLGRVPTIGQAYDIDPDKTVKLIDSYTELALRYVNARTKPTSEQVRMMTLLIVSRWPSLKLTQLMLFWVKLLSGDFGKLYNNIDPLDITTRLNRYINDTCAGICRRAREVGTWEQWEPGSQKCTLIQLKKTST